MKRFGKILSVPMITAALAGFGFAGGDSNATHPSQLRPSERSDRLATGHPSMSGTSEEGFIIKERVAGVSDYCHMKFPAIQQETLSSTTPVLEPRTSGEVIDFYGPCNYDPDGRVAVLDQKRDMQHRFEREYHDG